MFVTVSTNESLLDQTTNSKKNREELADKKPKNHWTRYFEHDVEMSLNPPAELLSRNAKELLTKTNLVKLIKSNENGTTLAALLPDLQRTFGRFSVADANKVLKTHEKKLDEAFEAGLRDCVNMRRTANGDLVLAVKRSWKSEDFVIIEDQLTKEYVLEEIRRRKVIALTKLCAHLQRAFGRFSVTDANRIFGTREKKLVMAIEEGLRDCVKVYSIHNDDYMLIFHQCQMPESVSHPEQNMIAQQPIESVDNLSEFIDRTPVLVKLDQSKADNFEFIYKLCSPSRGTSVNLVRDRTNDQMCLYAEKKIHKFHGDLQNDENLWRELQILQRVKHPYLVELKYAFETSEYLHLIMEYAPHGDLNDLISRDGTLTEEVTRSYMAQLTLALEYLHENRILHRDIKPKNILIAENGKIKLADFGVSKYGVATICSRNTGPVGTNDYIAPEIGTDYSQYSFPADWYSLGVVMCEMLTGKVARLVPDVHDLDISTQAHDLLIKLTDKNPNNRLGQTSKGATEVKSHPFFDGVDFETL